MLTLLVSLAAGAGMDARTVHHAMGDTVVPDRPDRVVTLSFESTESALALGITPIGAVRKPDGGFYPQAASALRSTRPVGEEDAPDIAAIAALKPDLILGLKLRQAALYSRLQQIAPTVFCETLRGRWRHNLQLWGEALGREKNATAVLAEWDRGCTTFRRDFPAAANTRVAVLRFMPAMLRIYHVDSFAMSIMAELGFQPSEFRASNDYFEALPVARLSELRSTQMIFYFTWDDGSKAAEDREQEVVTNARWAALPAIQAGQAFAVDDGIWNSGGGIISARALLAQLGERMRDREIRRSRGR